MLKSGAEICSIGDDANGNQVNIYTWKYSAWLCRSIERLWLVSTAPHINMKFVVTISMGNHSEAAGILLTLSGGF